MQVEIESANGQGCILDESTGLYERIDTFKRCLGGENDDHEFVGVDRSVIIGEMCLKLFRDDVLQCVLPEGEHDLSDPSQSAAFCYSDFSSNSFPDEVELMNQGDYTITMVATEDSYLPAPTGEIIPVFAEFESDDGKVETFTFNAMQEHEFSGDFRCGSQFQLRVSPSQIYDHGDVMCGIVPIAGRFDDNGRGVVNGHIRASFECTYPPSVSPTFAPSTAPTPTSPTPSPSPSPTSIPTTAPTESPSPTPTSIIPTTAPTTGDSCASQEDFWEPADWSVSPSENCAVWWMDSVWGANQRCTTCEEDWAQSECARTCCDNCEESSVQSQNAQEFTVPNSCVSTRGDCALSIDGNIDTYSWMTNSGSCGAQTFEWSIADSTWISGIEIRTTSDLGAAGSNTCLKFRVLVDGSRVQIQSGAIDSVGQTVEPSGANWDFDAFEPQDSLAEIIWSSVRGRTVSIIFANCDEGCYTHWPISTVRFLTSSTAK